MRNVIITGGTGMIGRLVLNACLENEEIDRVTSIARRPLGLSHSKLVEVEHHDFLDYSAIAEHLRGQDICYYCAGVYTGQVPTDEFKRITVDHTQAFSLALKQNSGSAVFCFLSGQGADTTEKSRLLFARQKGIAENNLLRLRFPRTYIFRPGYIYPVQVRKEPNFAYRLMRILYKPISYVYSNIGVTSVQLAHKMVETGLHGGSRTIFENRDIRM